MATVPEGTKFHGVASGVDTVNKGSSTANANRAAYTIEDIQQYLSSEEYTISAGGTTNYSGTTEIVLLKWAGGAGTHTFNLPSASSSTNRFFRIVTEDNFSASNKVDVTATGGDTIDGVASYEINKSYNGIAVWSSGTEWIVIQAKAT